MGYTAGGLHMGSQAKLGAGDLSKRVSVSQAAGSPIRAQREVSSGTKHTNSLALMFCALQRTVIQFLCLCKEQSVLTATGCHKEARLALDRVMDCFYLMHPH